MSSKLLEVDDDVDDDEEVGKRAPLADTSLVFVVDGEDGDDGVLLLFCCLMRSVVASTVWYCVQGSAVNSTVSDRRGSRTDEEEVEDEDEVEEKEDTESSAGRP